MAIYHKTHAFYQEIKIMKLSVFFKKTFVIFMIFYLMFPHNAYGYLDPGTGSLILQAIIVVFIGTVATGKLWYRRFKALISRLFSKDNSTENE